MKVTIRLTLGVSRTLLRSPTSLLSHWPIRIKKQVWQYKHKRGKANEKLTVSVTEGAVIMWGSVADPLVLTNFSKVSYRNSMSQQSTVETLQGVFCNLATVNACVSAINVTNRWRWRRVLCGGQFYSVWTDLLYQKNQIQWLRVHVLTTWN